LSICACLPALRAQPQPPKSGVDLALAGRCAEAMPLLDAGMRDAASALEAKRTVALAGVRCAMSLNQQNDALSFIAWLQQAYPKDPEVLFLAVHAFNELSLRNARDLMDTAPDSPLVVELNAENFEKQGDLAKAIAEYRILLQRTPDKPGIHFRVGGLIMSLPPTETSAAEARKEFAQELKINPQNAAAEYYLGELARQQDQLPEAIRHFERSTSLYPDFAEAYGGLGRSLLDSGKAADAVTPLETAVKLAPENPTIHLALATAYQRLGRKEDAAREFALQKSTAEKLNQNSKALHKNVSGADTAK
jgi:tetratricopeptide (TPR) repeat protein